jgi:hypothetical protein
VVHPGAIGSVRRSFLPRAVSVVFKRAEVDRRVRRPPCRRFKLRSAERRVLRSALQVQTHPPTSFVFGAERLRQVARDERSELPCPGSVSRRSRVDGRKDMASSPEGQVRFLRRRRSICGGCFTVDFAQIRLSSPREDRLRFAAASLLSPPLPSASEPAELR